jgi:type I restriction enzyme S subunit
LDGDLARYALESGDVLLVEGNANPDRLGNAALWRNQLPVALHQNHLIRIRPLRDILPEWLVNALASEAVRTQILASAKTSSGLHTINSTVVRKISRDLPPPGEQRKIAGIRSSVEDAIEATHAVIDQLQVVKKAMMAELLTRGLPGRHTRFKITEIGEVPEEWEVRPLPEVASWQNGKAFPSSDYATLGVRLVRPGNLAVGGVVVWDEKHTTHLPNQYAEEHPTFLVRPGELLMNLTAQSLEDEFLGRVCVTPDGPPCLLNQRIARIVPTAIDRRYLQWVLCGSHFRSHVDRIPKGSKVQHLYNADLEAARLSLPPRDEQRGVARILDALRERCAAEALCVQSLAKLKSALMSVLLTGEVRVKPDNGHRPLEADRSHSTETSL